MRQFEIGKRYMDSGVAFEIVKRTAKTVKYRKIYHPGRFNEKTVEEKSAKINLWDDTEVLVIGSRTITA